MGMSESTGQPSDADSPGVEQTVVIGYPEVAARPSPAPGSAIDGLRGQVRTLRLLLFACLAMLVLLAVGLGAALTGSKAQLDELSSQVSALTASAASAAAAPAAESPANAAAPQQEAVKQLGPSPELQGMTALPAGADATGAILIGDPNASDIVEVYIDYQCPFCQKWEQGIGAALFDRALQPGSGLLIKQYNLAFLGEQNADLTPAGASARAASAAACIIDADGQQAFVDFSRAVFATADPSEPPGQFTADVLTSLAKDAGASSGAIACIEGEENVPFVAATTRAGFGRGVGGTPTVVVNGQTVGNPFTDPALAEVASGT